MVGGVRVESGGQLGGFGGLVECDGVVEVDDLVVFAVDDEVGLGEVLDGGCGVEPGFDEEGAEGGGAFGDGLPGGESGDCCDGSDLGVIGGGVQGEWAAEGDAEDSDAGWIDGLLKIGVGHQCVEGGLGVNGEVGAVDWALIVGASIAAVVEEEDIEACVGEEVGE